VEKKFQLFVTFAADWGTWIVTPAINFCCEEPHSFSIMKTKKSLSLIASKALVIIALLAATHSSVAETSENKVLDDFSDPFLNNLGVERMYVDDTSAGGKTTVVHSVTDGVLSVKGEIVPARGQLGWASTVLLLDALASPVDLSAYEGIRLRLRIKAGNVSVSANSADVTNYDFHAALVMRDSGNGFQEVEIPFSSMKRAWSEQTPLNTQTIQSISLVAFGMQAGAFEYEVDEVSFIPTVSK